MQYSASWLDHFKRHADAARDKVKEETKVGAVLIGPNNEVLLTAYNGPAIGVIDTPARRSREGGLKYKYAAHAERNLISFAARRGLATEGLTIYSTHHPCSACAGAIIQAGIKCVIIGRGTFKSSDGDIEHAADALREAGVTILKHVTTSDVLDRADHLARAILPSAQYYKNKRALLNAPYEFSDEQRAALILYPEIDYSKEQISFIVDNLDTIVGNHLALLRSPLEILEYSKKYKTYASEIEIILAHLHEEINPEYHYIDNKLNQAEIDNIQQIRFKLIDHYSSEYGFGSFFYSVRHKIYSKDSYRWGNL